MFIAKQCRATILSILMVVLLSLTITLVEGGEDHHSNITEWSEFHLSIEPQHTRGYN